MRSEKTRSTTPRPFAISLLLLASGLACSATAAGPKAMVANSGSKAMSKSSANAEVKLIGSTSLMGRAVKSIRINDARATSSFGTVVDARGIEYTYLFNNTVVVQSNDWDRVETFVQGIPGAQLGRELGSTGMFRVVEAPSVAQAFDIQDALRGVDGVLNADVDSGLTDGPDRFARLREVIAQRRAAAEAAGIAPNPAQVQDHIGVIPFDGSVDPQVISPVQWNFVNSGANGFPQHDNNILESIFSTDLITGAGVNVGVVVSRFNVHLDVDHPELLNPGVRVGGYRDDLSQPHPTTTPDDSFLTSYAGIIAAERNAAGLDFQGVAPGAGVATIYRGPTPITEAASFEWKLPDIAIKVHELISEYDFTGGTYVPSRQLGYVYSSYKNSLRFGRRGKGTINIFSAGLTQNFLPDPYSSGFAETWDAVATAGGNEVSVSVTNDWSSGPFYPGGQTHQYPIANDYDTLIINSVSEDGFIDQLAAVGPGIFASVYAASTNIAFSGSSAISGQGLTTIGGSGATGVVIPTFVSDIEIANGTAAMTAGGIVALMLEANPNLDVRDIKHIFFESIQESTRAASIKTPNYDPNRVYYFPDAPPLSSAFLGRSFWQTNAGLYTNDSVVPTAIQPIAHSDQYGFGVVDADLAIQKARTWGRLPPLIALDTGVVGDVNQDEEVVEDPRVPVDIEDATFATPSVEADIDGTDGAVSLVINTDGIQQIRFCVRQNLRIESIVVELTIEGEGSNDLYMTLTSPYGTRSILSLPTTSNPSGTSDMDNMADDEFDLAYSSGNVNGTTYAYYQHPFLTHKHWGELSGGSWAIDFADYGPDMENPEGVEPGDDPMAMPPEPGGDMVITLGEIGIPGSQYRSAKVVTAFRVRIYGTETGADPFFGCAPGATSCPGDLNADGIVNNADFILFLNWYQTGDARADLTGDGFVDILDVLFYRGIFVPGRCTTSGSGVINGRPRPSTTNSSDNNPITHPI